MAKSTSLGVPDTLSDAEDLRVVVGELKDQLRVAQDRVAFLELTLKAVSRDGMPEAVVLDARRKMELGFDEGDAFTIALRDHAATLRSKQTAKAS